MWDVSSAGPLTGAAVSVALLIFGLSQTQSGGGGDAAAAASLLVRVCVYVCFGGLRCVKRERCAGGPVALPSLSDG